MKKLTLIFISLSIVVITKSQCLPDSIVIIYSRHAPEWFDKGTIYFSDTVLIVKSGIDYQLLNKKVSSKNIKALYDEIKNPLSLEESFFQSGVDTTIISKKPLSLKKNYKEYKYKWNESQTSFIVSELSNITNYIEQYQEYLNPYKGVSIPSYHENEIIVECFRNNILTDKLISNKSIPFRLYQFPWINPISNTEYYNIKLGEILLDIVGLENSSENFSQKGKLLNHLAAEIVKSKRQQLLELSANTYLSEINELKNEFTVIRSREKTTYGGYTGDGGIIVSILHNKKMLPNLFISLGLAKQKKTLYTRDSIKSDYQDIVNRIQSINFINNYLTENFDRKLYIHYFNNKPINTYIYDHVQRTCVTRQLDEAITFELVNENNDTSLWLLFPNDLMLLFRMDGEKVLNYPYTQFGENKGNLYPCLRFDKNGNITDL